MNPALSDSASGLGQTRGSGCACAVGFRSQLAQIRLQHLAIRGPIGEADGQGFLPFAPILPRHLPAAAVADQDLPTLFGAFVPGLDALILYLYRRKFVGWAMSDAMPQELTLAALAMALGWRDPPAGLTHHSDRGSQYAAGDYRKVL
ncbi:MAG: hypothetical protein KGJ55_03750, partial [Gammaproteobacteria bacterium]|nr:hypothetical protein [Gammaproteobacteria bacterium]